MQIKLTFEDGSDGYLEHHGIKGMKWGVWNDETRARRMGLHGGGETVSNRSKSAKKPFLSDRQKNMLKTGAKATAITAGAIIAASVIPIYVNSGSLAVAENAKEILKARYSERASKLTSDLLNATASSADRDKIRKDLLKTMADHKQAEKLIDMTQKGLVAATTTGLTIGASAINSAGLHKTIEAGGGLDFYNKKKADKKPKNYNYKADGKRFAKAGLEQDFATKSTVRWDSANERYYNATNTGKVRAKQNRRITKDPEIRRLNAEYNSVAKKYGTSSKEATQALANFQQKGQDLAVGNVSKYRNAYLKDLGEKRTREGKKALDTTLMNEVYLGPATWSNGLDKGYAKALGVPNKIKKSDR